MALEAYEYVQNYSNRPIPEPVEFSIVEKRRLSDCQRRAHLQDYDQVYKRDPLSDEERAWLEEQQVKILNARTIAYAGHELRFGPGQIYQVPRGHADRIVALNPGRLRKLTWAQVRVMEDPVTEVHIQTPEEAIAIAIAASDGGDDGIKSAVAQIEVKDGQFRFGEGAWQPLVRG